MVLFLRVKEILLLPKQKSIVTLNIKDCTIISNVSSKDEMLRKYIVSALNNTLIFTSPEKFKNSMAKL
jgi:hypothetical protein